MLRKSLPFLFIMLLLLLASCSAVKIPVPSGSQIVLTENYINTYKDLAIREMNRTGVPASITLAQGMIESDYGRSSLAVQANNHFGIKCHTDWNGGKYYKNDDKRNECFRKYNNYEDSFKDHSDFLVNGVRYSSLFKLDPVDYKSWAKGLKQAGYATNPDYADLLIRKIEEYGLYNFDNASTTGREMKIVAVKKDGNEEKMSSSGVVSKPADDLNVSVGYSRIFVRNRIFYIIVKEGDTFDSLLEEFQLLRFELERYNDLPSDFKIVPGQILYLQPKRKKADAGSDYHTVKEKETMYYVSQLYGVKLESLYEMNRMIQGTEPVTGQKLWLRNIKPPV